MKSRSHLGQILIKLNSSSLMNIFQTKPQVLRLKFKYYLQYFSSWLKFWRNFQVKWWTEFYECIVWIDFGAGILLRLKFYEVFYAIDHTYFYFMTMKMLHFGKNGQLATQVRDKWNIVQCCDTRSVSEMTVEGWLAGIGITVLQKLVWSSAYALFCWVTAPATKSGKR